MKSIPEFSLNFKETQNLWNEIPVHSHTGNLAYPPRVSARKLLHECVSYYKPKKCVEFGFNVGHSALLTIDAAGLDVEFHAFDVVKTTSDRFVEAFPNFKFYKGDSIKTFSKLDIKNIDFAFIDSLHTYDQVKGEIEVIFDSLSSGGILFFDDMNKKELNQAIVDNKYYERMTEITNWKSDYHVVAPFFEANSGWRWKTINRIFQKK